MALSIKICGLSTEPTLQAAIDGGATHAGFIFFEKSPRNIAAETAADLSQIAQTQGVKTVAVTVNADDTFLGHLKNTMQPDLFQLHGGETPARVLEVKKQFELPVIKAVSVSQADDLEKARSFDQVADHLLLDAKPPKGAELPGGNGIQFDWSLLKHDDAPESYFLSGGLNPQNIGEAISKIRPMGVDLSSGVESSPGVKDIGLIKALFDAIKTAEKNPAQ